MMDPEEKVRKFYLDYTIVKLPQVSDEIITLLSDFGFMTHHISQQHANDIPNSREKRKEHYDLAEFIKNIDVKRIILRGDVVSKNKNRDFTINDPELIKHLLVAIRPYQRDNWLGYKPSEERPYSVLFTVVGFEFQRLTDLKSLKVPDQFIADFINWAAPEMKVTLSAYLKARTRFIKSKENRDHLPKK